jgi:hypothetical protein
LHPTYIVRIVYMLGTTKADDQTVQAIRDLMKSSHGPLAVVASSPSKRFGQTKSFEVARSEEIRGIPMRLLITQH